MKILVRYEGYPAQLIDGEWRCQHDNVEVTPPCCNAGQRIIECGCQGRYSIYCKDCQNEDLRDYEISDIIGKALEKYE